MAIVREGSPGEGSKTTGVGVGFVKQVGFKPGVNEGELWMNRVVNQEEEVMGEGTGESVGDKCQCFLSPSQQRQNTERYSEH